MRIPSIFKKTDVTPAPPQKQRLEERHRETSADGLFARRPPRPSQAGAAPDQPGGPVAPPAML
jgi:hypothetical protein